MKHLNKSILALAVSAAMIAPASVMAGDKMDGHDQGAAMSENTPVFQNGWRAGKIESALLFNKNLNNFAIDVDVDGSTATLSGKVSSDVEKDLAEEIALGIDGIDKVSNDLNVDPEHKEAAKSQDVSDTIDDATITANVKLRLLANKNVSATSINVDTSGNVVTLRGKVKSDEERDLAEAITSNVDAVVSVDNKLKVSAS